MFQLVEGKTTTYRCEGNEALEISFTAPDRWKSFYIPKEKTSSMTYTQRKATVYSTVGAVYHHSLNNNNVLFIHEKFSSRAVTVYYSSFV